MRASKSLVSRTAVTARSARCLRLPCPIFSPPRYAPNLTPPFSHRSSYHSSTPKESKGSARTAVFAALFLTAASGLAYYSSRGNKPTPRTDDKEKHNRFSATIQPPIPGEGKRWLISAMNVYEIITGLALRYPRDPPQYATTPEGAFEFLIEGSPKNLEFKDPGLMENKSSVVISDIYALRRLPEEHSEDCDLVAELAYAELTEIGPEGQVNGMAFDALMMWSSLLTGRSPSPIEEDLSDISRTEDDVGKLIRARTAPMKKEIRLAMLQHCIDAKVLGWPPERLKTINDNFGRILAIYRNGGADLTTMGRAIEQAERARDEYKNWKDKSLYESLEEIFVTLRAAEGGQDGQMGSRVWQLVWKGAPWLPHFCLPALCETVQDTVDKGDVKILEDWYEKKKEACMRDEQRRAAARRLAFEGIESDDEISI